ncbi:helix-turn-helix transcriptional regulator [Crossiella cryophila]|uniref:DNA-binding NarL/FixJ family response regulator n=1 Tax=Crossiella cryophila TaxID=43355 RepID=A0A7W7FUU0_9PSEU|nr:response regulator transcription factor [Crossiella cryophila]MBB4678592.1 DNA-binding NarL/FixJ family response regulator [Crossiella cryophila]
MKTTKVAVLASDQLIGAESVGLVRNARELEHVDLAAAEVVLLIEHVVTRSSFAALHSCYPRLPATPRTRCVVVTDHLEPGTMTYALSCGLAAVLPLHEIDGQRLTQAILSVRQGNAHFPAHLQGELVSELARIHQDVLVPSGLTAAGLTEREVDVLTLLADGFDTDEIAAKLCYSERTVKNVLYRMMTRYNLGNRTEAVAFAVRAGVC